MRYLRGYSSLFRRIKCVDNVIVEEIVSEIYVERVSERDMGRE